MSTARPTLDLAAVLPTSPVVASVPAGHVYVAHLDPESGDGPTRLPDPSDPWWPPTMLDPHWIRTHDFDLMHLHFGFDAVAPERLADVVAALRDTGRPLVQTVHDLRNPHQEDRSIHDRQLDVLVPAAEALVTLTDGAAAEIERRWGRRAVVLPHPHVVPFGMMRAAAAMRAVRRRRGEAAPLRIGMHVKSLRASMAPERLLPTLVAAVRDLPDAVLQINAHRDVMDPRDPHYAAGLAPSLRAHAEVGDLDLRVHDYLSDDAWFAYLAELDVAVLPYRFGTHSGWLEACRDLGTTVIAPSCGYYADQGPVLTYLHDEDVYDPDSLVQALRSVHAERPDLGATVEERRRQRAMVAAGHDRLYRAVLGG